MVGLPTRVASRSTSRRRGRATAGFRSGFAEVDLAGLLRPGAVRGIVGHPRLVRNLLRSLAHHHAVICQQPCTLATIGSTRQEVFADLVVVHTPQSLSGQRDPARTAPYRAEVERAPITYLELTSHDSAQIAATVPEAATPLLLLDTTRHAAGWTDRDLRSLARAATSSGTSVWLALPDPAIPARHRRRRRTLDSMWSIDLAPRERPGGTAQLTAHGPRRRTTTQPVGDIAYRARISPLVDAARTSVAADGTIVTVRPGHPRARTHTGAPPC